MSDSQGLPGLLGSTTGGLVNDIGKNLFGSTSGGNRTYYRGLPLYLRTSRYATVHNKANRVIQAMPRFKFMYYATFNPGPALSKITNFSTWQQGFAFQINKIDRPKASPQLKELNQYNRKRLIHTGIEYADMNITLHDTVDDRVLRVWRDYHKWYFGDGRPKNTATTWKSSVVQKNFPVSNGWGFSPPTTSGWDTNFFDSLDVYVFYGKKFTQVRIYNPKISSINFDSLESDSSALSSVDMSIKHEGFEYLEVAAPITNKQITLFNLNSGDYYEPSDLFGGVNAFLLDLNDNLESSIDSLLNNVARNVPFVGETLAGLGASVIRGSNATGFIPNVAQNLASSSLGRWGVFQ